MDTDPKSYRTPAPFVPSPERMVSPERLAHLERCEAVLDAVGDASDVDFISGSRGGWFVQRPTGKYNDVYPEHEEGEGATLREAVENVMGWGAVPEIAKPRSRAISLSITIPGVVFIVAVAVVAGLFLL